MTGRRGAMAFLGAVLAVATATAPLAGPVGAPPAGAQTGAPPRPVTVEGRAVGRDGLGVEWSQSPGAIDYQLYAFDPLTASTVGPVHGAGTLGEISGLATGVPYLAGVAARGPDGTSDITWELTPTVVAPSAPPDAVADVQATASETSTRVTVRWEEAVTGVRPDFYAVEVTDSRGAVVGSLLSCEYPCTQRTVDGLEPGTYRFRVGAANWTGGVTWAPAPEAVVVDDRCARGGACLAVAAAGDLGAAERRAQGVNGGIQNMDPALLRPLNLRFARVSDEPGYQTASAIGADITWLVSNSWYQRTFDAARGGAAFPWSDWGAYDGYVRDLAHWMAVLAPVDRWDVQNEPYLGYFGPTSADHPRTVEELVDHLVHAATALRAGDPSAFVVGPSYDNWNDGRMRSFLDEAVERRLDLDALSWHELVPAGATVNQSPAGLVDHVQRTRRLLAERPSLADVELHVNEYGGPHDHRLAGWVAGYIGALEAADVDLAMRTCWTEAECAWERSAAALFEPGTGRTLAPYWVHRFYGSQEGRRLPSTSSNANVTSFATRDGGTVRVLVGRHQTCVRTVNPACDDIATGTPYDVPLTISGLPARARATVRVERVPATTGPVTAPTAVSSRVVRADGSGTLTVTLPRVADGEAWLVTAGT